MTMKKAELEKRKGLKIANDMRRAGNPYARSGETEAERRAQRTRERALGLIPFAVKLPDTLVRRLHAEARARNVPLHELAAQLLDDALAR